MSLIFSVHQPCVFCSLSNTPLTRSEGIQLYPGLTWMLHSLLGAMSSISNLSHSLAPSRPKLSTPSSQEHVSLGEEDQERTKWGKNTSSELSTKCVISMEAPQMLPILEFFGGRASLEY